MAARGCHRSLRRRLQFRLRRLLFLAVAIAGASALSLALASRSDVAGAPRRPTSLPTDGHPGGPSPDPEGERRGAGPAPRRRVLSVAWEHGSRANSSRGEGGHGAGVGNGSAGEHQQGEYPQDIFSLEERRRGAVALHMLGMMYMFMALAIVCDEFFVPALGVITDKLAISDDVAGATFMAAGGSAPELFTSMIGVFISHSNVGIGTIVGSAVFNILFVIGMCAVFSRELLTLTWWPIFRDVSFYVLDLLMLIIFFLDNSIAWWESTLLLGGYASYVVFMKYNAHIEAWVKARLPRSKATRSNANGDKASGSSSDPLDVMKTMETQLEVAGSDRATKAVRGVGERAPPTRASKIMRNSLFQLMIYSLEPLGEEIHGVGSNQKFYETITKEAHLQEQLYQTSEAAFSPAQTCMATADGCSGAPEATAKALKDGEVNAAAADDKTNGGTVLAADGQQPAASEVGTLSRRKADGALGAEEEEEEDSEIPMSLKWPSTWRKRLSYLLLLPIVLPLWATLPDVRKPEAKKFFIIAFFGSILWIAMFSYLMVWWAHQVGETIGITEEIMGLTILAAGTSIPDLITSVIVARKGLGDMAVSSSVGSNIFDITVGLPLPWLLFSMINGLAPVTVSSNGLFCAILLLFMMLVLVIGTIAACRWRMSKLLGLSMFLLYFVFLVLSVLLELQVLSCPITI
ncbi:sodium/potassium/calcium exchanger 2-like [Petromyzon marinus]|uniref:sodium/potassium/calcium exchanger 2-like n=1 Tax=Petromyzon marinus TaxID=7757 RepID=UPI003F6FA053